MLKFFVEGSFLINKTHSEILWFFIIFPLEERIMPGCGAF
jgi:hypothetical protein